jgi:hypothetical protein
MFGFVGKAIKGVKLYKSWRNIFKPPSRWRIIMPDGQTVEVPVKSAWSSKINWTELVKAGAVLLTMFGVTLDGETQKMVVAAIVAGGGVVTWVLRTWFNNSATPNAVKNGGGQ